MNNKKLLSALVLTGTFLAGDSVFADEHKHDYLSCFTAKVSHGFMNAATGIIEIPKNIVNISQDENILVGITWGTIRGVFHTVGRTVVGAAELITAPIPTDDYISPPYVWDRFSEDTRYFGAHLPGFWTTYGPLDDGE